MPMRFTLAGRQLHADQAPGAAPDSRCVVFVHGALNDRSVWTHAARWCRTQGLGVLVPDLPGHGLSEGPPDADIGAMADTLLALLRSAGLGRIVLVGHSMGSLIALEVAARLAGPDKAPQDPQISDLVMVGTAFPMRVAPVLLQQAAEAPLQAIELIASLSHAGPSDGRAERQAASRARMQRVLAGCDARRLPEGRPRTSPRSAACRPGPSVPPSAAAHLSFRSPWRSAPGCGRPAGDGRRPSRPSGRSTSPAA